MPINGYQVKTWEAGDVITANALNDVEHGIADVILVQNTDPKEDGETYNNGAFNKIWINPESTSIEVPTMDEFNEIKRVINQDEYKGDYIDIWTLGNLDKDTGLPRSNDTTKITAHSDYIIYPKEKYHYLFLYITIEYQGFIYCYDKNKTFIGPRIGFTSPGGIYSLKDNTYYIRISARHKDIQEVNEEELITITPEFDEELAKTGVIIKYITTSTVSGNSALGNMVKTAATYFKQASEGKISYESGHIGIYENSVYCTEEGHEGQFHIICNSFVNSCLKGTTFEKSRYVNLPQENVEIITKTPQIEYDEETGKEKTVFINTSSKINIEGANYEADWAWISDGTGYDGEGHYYIDTETGQNKSSYLYAYDYLTSNQLAHYAYNHNFLHEVTDCRDDSASPVQPDPYLSRTWKNNIRPGDVIFSGNAFDDRGLFAGIDHCAIVVNSTHKTLQDGRRIYNVNVMEAYNSKENIRFRRNVRTLEDYQISSWTYYATFPVKNTIYTTNKIHIPFHLSTIPGSSGNKILAKEYSIPLSPGVYTFIVYRTFNENYRSGKSGYLVLRIFDEDGENAVTMCEGENKSEITIYSNKEFTWQIEKGDVGRKEPEEIVEGDTDAVVAGYPTGIDITGIDIYEDVPPVLVEGPQESKLVLSPNVVNGYSN